MKILKTIPFLGIFLFIQYSYVQPTAASEKEFAERMDAYEWARGEIDDFYENCVFEKNSELNESLKKLHSIS